ncbi:putative integron gene cassette protein [Luteimonas sp. 9C]|uniref:hypothetical protein n=1 Tax=Luteimonas sp. 9C TaxID=2653148 RepID=UPI0012F23864|nr:hypothetical protein [Luteimonas sp. 9C]VXC06145.1 putative integron gene cassette protein [Luteimonas sp. 9C]
MDLPVIPMGMLVLTGLAFAVAAFCHWQLRGFWRASLVSAIANPLLFAVASSIQERGLPSPFSLEAFAMFGGFSLLVALIVGGIVVLARRVLPVGA